MSKASIVGLTSAFEGLSLVGIEAMATGVPFVAYDIPTGPAAIIQDGVNGFLVPSANTGVFADKLRLLMSDSKMREQMGRRARTSASRYAEKLISEKWEELFLRLTQSSIDHTLTGNGLSPQAKEHETHVVPLNPANSSSHTLASVLKSLSEQVIPWAPVCTSSTTPAIAIMDTALEDLSRAFASLEEGTVIRYGNANGTDSRWLSKPAELWRSITTAQPEVISVVTGCDLEQASISHPSSFVDIEIWSRSATGTYKPPRRNLAEDEVESSFFKQTPQELTLKQFNQQVEKVWSVPSFDVDLVYMWVDGNDPQWQRKRERYSDNSARVHESAVDSTRFENREELRYSLRSVSAFAPWVHKIYIVTDNQVPYWLETNNSMIQVIDHKDIFPDTSVLPTFNSHSIETCLHRIPGLSEHYIVVNDDVLFRRPVSKGQFFTSAGQARFFLSPVKIGDTADPAPHIQAAHNNRELIENRFGKSITQCFLHTPHPHLRSLMEQVESEFPNQVEHTRSSRFRSPHDVSLCSSLGQYYGYFTHAYVQGSIRYSYLKINASTTERRMQQILHDRRLDTFAIGENTGSAEQENTNKELRDFFGQIVPWKSPFEKD